MTADVVELLRQVGKGECPECQAALRWLKAMQNRHGGWYSFAGAIGEQQDTPGDPDATAQITFLMGELYGEDDPAYTRGRQSFESALGQPRRIQKGYDVSDLRVKQIMEALIDIQREDGGWRPFSAEQSSPVYTALAVKVLVLSGMLAHRDLSQAALQEAAR